MKDRPEIWARWETGQFVGSDRSSAYVTVEPNWGLQLDDSVTNGRWFQSSSGTERVEVEVPNVKNISIKRDLGTDAASCTISIYNILPYELTEDGFGPDFNPNVPNVPGYYTPGRGWSPEATRWGQTPNDWSGEPGVSLPYLTHMALLRTYQGYGGWQVTGSPMSLSAALTAGVVAITGTWIVDSVTIGSDGILTLQCRDAAKFLIEQFLYPPIAPTTGDNVYPIHYQRWIYTSYDREWDTGDIVTTNDIWPDMLYYNSATDVAAGGNPDGPDVVPPVLNLPVNGHYPAEPGTNVPHHGPPNDWALSGGNADGSQFTWYEFDISGSFNRVWVGNFRGANQIFISVKVNGVWQGTELTPHGIPYLVQGGLNGTPDVGAGAWFAMPGTIAAPALRISVKQSENWDSGNIFGDLALRFRAALWDVRASLLSSTPGSGNGITGSSYAMARFPGPGDGVWIVSTGGIVYPIGDAGDLGASGRTWTRTLGSTVVALEEYPLENTDYPLYGWGFYELLASGTVNANDGAVHYGHEVGGPQNFVDIASHPSGEGYWTLRSDGRVYAFGTLAADYGGIEGVVDAERTACAIVADPNGFGYWVIDRFGDIYTFDPFSFGMPTFPGGFEPPTYGSPPGAARFREGVATPSGQGMWGLFDDGTVRVVGDAALYTEATGSGQTDAHTYFDYGNSFETNFWTMARTNSGSGYRILQTNGHIYTFGDAIVFTPDLTDPQTREPGNYLDYSEIIEDILAWSGFVLHETGGIHGNIETTGAWSEEDLGIDVFDKKSCMDVITMIKEIVGYHFWIDDEGAARFESPNWWLPQNIYEDGTITTFIPAIDELYHLTAYGAQLSDTDLRSEIIIANFLPTDDNSGTVVTRQVPQGAEYLRGMQKPAIWTNEVFLKPAEQQAMAELVALHIFFSMRQGSVTCIGNPCIQINDQVTIYEMVSAESFIHYVRGVATEHDLDTGVYTMTLTTNWLGDGDSWAVQPVNNGVTPAPIGGAGGAFFSPPPGPPPPPSEAPPG